MCQRFAAQARKSQQVIHQPPHQPGVIMYQTQVTLRSGVNSAACSSKRMRVKPSMARSGARRSCETE